MKGNSVEGARAGTLLREREQEPPRTEERLGVGGLKEGNQT